MGKSLLHPLHKPRLYTKNRIAPEGGAWGAGLGTMDHTPLRHSCGRRLLTQVLLSGRRHLDQIVDVVPPVH